MGLLFYFLFDLKIDYLYIILVMLYVVLILIVSKARIVSLSKIDPEDPAPYETLNNIFRSMMMKTP